MHFCYESEKTVSGPICSRIVALYHQNSQWIETGRSGVKKRGFYVASHVGAWIETR